jgi:uncharacterized protein YbbC (DUF1343 family)
MQTHNFIFLLLLIVTYFSGHCQTPEMQASEPAKQEIIFPGAFQFDELLPLLKGKRIGVVANHTSLINSTHLVDSLLSSGINVVRIFGPEHGFRGDHPDGKEINSGKDPITGLEIISLYGNHKKPTKTDLENIEIILFDIQDVGTRFYTYISTLTYVMEACADNNIPVIVTDRPNPNGFYVDGPVLDPAFTSFVGLHPVPIVYGLTIGEYAVMVNGEKWLEGGNTCDLTIIKCMNYTHNSRYQLTIGPSPNLQDMKAVYLYPSLCLFEGTVVSIGRGTENPFKVYGHPELEPGSYSFTPRPIKGVSENPPLMGQLCFGYNLSDSSESIKNHGRLELSWLQYAYKYMDSKNGFFTNYFDKIAGNSKLREQITSGKSESEIRKSWKPELELFKEKRKKYLLYPDFD